MTVISAGTRCGLWYDVFFDVGTVNIVKRDDKDLQDAPPECIICAFDIETTKVGGETLKCA